MTTVEGTNRTGETVYEALWRMSALVLFAMAGAVAVFTARYDSYPASASPGSVRTAGLFVAAALGAIAILQLATGERPPRSMRMVFLYSNLIGVIAMLWLFRFDAREPLFALLIVATAQGAIVLRRRGVALMWLVTCVAYVDLALATQEATGVPANPVVIALRLAILLFVGLLISKLTRDFAASVDAERARARDADFHALVLAQVRDAVIATDLDHNITAWNSGAEATYGWEEREVLGKDLNALLRPELLERHSARGDDSEQRVGLFAHQTKDGSAVFVEVMEMAIRQDGAFAGRVAVNRDVTERRRSEEMAREAESAVRMNIAKTQFLDRMSHELRAPLNSVLGFGQLLSMDNLTPSQKENVNQITRSGNRLLAMVDEVLDTTSLESGNLSLSIQAIPVSQSIAEAAALVALVASDRGVTLETPGDASTTWVFADSARLRQVLLNLMANAVKYNRVGGHVTVTAESTQGGQARIAVEDTGPGIAPEMMGRLFTPFDRLGAEQSGVDGAGLGLALSRQLAEAMGGRLSASSEVGIGSRFSIELPIAAAGSFEADVTLGGGEWEEAESHPEYVVLYVEDQLSNLDLMERIFERRPQISLLTAMQGQLGLEIARQERPDLVLLDLNLPDISGEEVLKRLRQDPRTAEVTVVVLSADTTDMSIKRMLAAGAFDYLTKPIDVGKLLALVDERLAAKDEAATRREAQTRDATVQPTTLP